MTLLTRDEFRDQVFSRDSHKCVICKSPADAAHHIVDRSLWDDSGYYTENGVSLCPQDHVLAEQTLISCDQLRHAANIQTILLPEHFFIDEKYDHWGNILLPNKMRVRGELFGNENVQKILSQAGVLNQFLPYIKYPRMYHCPWSPNLDEDDKMHKNLDFFLRKPIVATLKMDGENSNFYPDYFHARSLDSNSHLSQSWVRALHGKIAYEIPKGFRICGEDLYAKHSIHYHHLKSFFYVYSIWNETNVALSWDETVEYAELLGLEIVPEFCCGTYFTVEELKRDVETHFDAFSKQCPDEVEGYVIRLADRIPYRDFRRATAKVVRKDHVKTGKNWLKLPIIPNKLA